MRALVFIGALLIVLGFAGVTIPSITYEDTETIAQIGPFEVRQEEQRSVPIPELAGVMALVAGVCLLVLGAQSKP